ncbi:MAG: glycoside hydrolase family 28 protein [Prevotella sp.]|nr:glycoside hydrolase family 28 protein [Prevotella sp.]
MRKILLISMAALFLTGCIQQPKAEKQLTPQEQIIENIARTSFPDKVWKVQLDESGNMLQALQQAIDSCSYYGGGVVDVAPGKYALNGPLKLKSNVNLHLQEGAYLQFSGRSKDFLPVVLTRWEGTEMYGHSPMIYAYHATNIAITGKGTIDAQAGLEFATWGPKEANDRDRLREMGDKLTPVQERIFGEGTILRPSFVQFYGCSRILVEDVTLKDSPFWTIHPVFCDNVIVRGVTIDSHFPNNDGCDPESTSNVLIENCTFRTGDDAVAIKAGRDTDGRATGRPSENIVVRNCSFFSECNGLCIGSEMSGGASNVYMENVEIGTVKNAIYFKSNKDRGGYIRNVVVNNIKVERAKGAILRFETNYFGYRGGNYQTIYEDFRITNVVAKEADNYAVFMEGNDDQKINDIVIENFTVEKARQACHLLNTADVRFVNTLINGEKIEEEQPEDTSKVVLDVW